jgi:uncharacterized protein
LATQSDKQSCALVTGASAGIGRELAKVFAENGHSLVLLARREDKLQALAEELKSAHGSQVTIVPADLDDPRTPQAIYNGVAENGIEVDVLVNNAGVLFDRRFADIPIEDHRQLVQVNVLAPTLLSRFFLPPMLVRKKGRILNVASIAGFMPIPDLAAYAASKAFILSLSQALSEEVKGTGVTVTALCPGVTGTQMAESSELGKLPGFMVMDARTVAREGYSACMAGQAVHIAGPLNELAVTWVKYQPDWLVRAVGGFVSRMPRG